MKKLSVVALIAQRKHDLLGFWVSLICAIHCIAPAIIAISYGIGHASFGHSDHISHAYWDVGFVILALIAGVPAIFKEGRTLLKWGLIISLAIFSVTTLAHAFLHLHNLIWLAISASLFLAAIHLFRWYQRPTIDSKLI
ncbi:MAG: MerC domain-containing protein [Cyclobacteriaceae bacterium]|nr:MerC domain-containing protein [Cyclobacteriaceae bacterium]MCH8517130.1 MerC domain-containing protein [Cyclobacteriaceae bacterium]